MTFDNLIDIIYVHKIRIGIRCVFRTKRKARLFSDKSVYFCIVFERFAYFDANPHFGLILCRAEPLRGTCRRFFADPVRAGRFGQAAKADAAVAARARQIPSVRVEKGAYAFSVL